MNELRQWFTSQPFNTKWIAVFSLIFPLLLKFQIISPSLLVWDWYSISQKFQVWRMVTPMFLTRVSFNLIFSLYFRFQYSFYLETNVFAGRPADYLYFLMLSTMLINVMNYFVGLAVLWEPLSMTIVYLWAKHNSEVIVNFMFGFKFKAMFLPAVLAVMEFLFAGDLYGPLFGIIAAHTYYVISEVLVQKDPRWRTRLTAPGWMKSLIPDYRPVTADSFKGFTVQRPDQGFAGRSNTAAGPADSSSSFSAFSGLGQKIGK